MPNNNALRDWLPGKARRLRIGCGRPLKKKNRHYNAAFHKVKCLGQSSIERLSLLCVPGPPGRAVLDAIVPISLE